MYGLTKDDFLKIPNADYSPGPISKYGDAFGWMKHNLDEHFKAQHEANKGLSLKEQLTSERAINEDMSNVAGMFIPATKIGLGTFQDINTKKLMRWISDNKAKILTNRDRADALLKVWPKEVRVAYKLFHEGKITKEQYAAKIKPLQDKLDDKFKSMKDINGKLKFEYRKAALKDLDKNYIKAEEAPEGSVYKAKEFLQHPKLYKTYPKSKETINSTVNEPTSSTVGSFYPDQNLVEINSAKSPREQTSNALHETQHFIQHQEDWPAGGSPQRFLVQANKELKILKMIERQAEKDFYSNKITRGALREIRDNVRKFDVDQRAWELYNSLVGEQQSRAVQAAFEKGSKTPYYDLTEIEGKLPRPQQ